MGDSTDDDKAFQPGVATATPGSEKLRDYLMRRLADLQQSHQQKLAQRAALAASIADSQERLRALDIEIAGVQGHGAEAEQFLSVLTGQAAESGGDGEG